MDRQKRAQEHYGDIIFCILESFPLNDGKALRSCLSMLSVCPVASSVELLLRQLPDFHDRKISYT